MSVYQKYFTITIMDKIRSWVWEYANRKGDKSVCGLSDEGSNIEYSFVGGTTLTMNKIFKNKASN